MVAWFHRSSNQLVSRTTPLVLSATFTVSSRLHWELVEKLQLPTSAVFVEVPYRTFAWFPPNLFKAGLSGSPRTYEVLRGSPRPTRTSTPLPAARARSA